MAQRFDVESEGGERITMLALSGPEVGALYALFAVSMDSLLGDVIDFQAPQFKDVDPHDYRVVHLIRHAGVSGHLHEIQRVVNGR